MTCRWNSVRRDIMDFLLYLVVCIGLANARSGPTLPPARIVSISRPIVLCELHRCVCQDETVDCDGNDFTSLRSGKVLIPQTVQSLRIVNSRGLEPMLRARFFSSMTNLTKLVLSNNGIRVIYNDTFRGLNNLQSLSLTEPDINIHEGSFDKMKNLQNLFFTGPDRMTLVPAYLFRYQDKAMVIGDPGKKTDERNNLKLQFWTNFDLFDDDCVSGQCYSVCGEPDYLNDDKEEEGVNATNDAEAVEHIHAMHYDLAKLDGLVGTKFVWAQMVTLSQKLYIPDNLTISVITREFYIKVETANTIFRFDKHRPCEVTITRTGTGTVWYQVTFGSMQIFAKHLHGVDRSACNLNPHTQDATVLIQHMSHVTLEYFRAVTVCSKLKALDVSDRKQPLDMLDWTLTMLSWSQKRGSESYFTEALLARSEIKKTSDSTRFVPYLSQQIYSDILDQQYRLANDYNKQFNHFVGAKKDDKFRLRLLQDMYQEANGLAGSSEIDRKLAKDALETAKKAVDKLKQKFDETKPKIEVERKKFEAGMKQYFIEESARIIFDIFKSVFQIFSGKPANVIDGIEGIWSVLEKIRLLYWTLSRVIKANEAMMKKVSGEKMKVADERAYLEDLDMAAELPKQIVEWQNMVLFVIMYLTEGNAVNIIGSRGYRHRLRELAGWGEALTRETIRQTDLMRTYLAKEAAQEARSNYNEVMQAATELAEKEQKVNQNLLKSLKIQMMDVKFSLIDTLHMYCQTYFYYQFTECSDRVKPKLSDSLEDLVRKMSVAKIEALTSLAILKPEQPMQIIIPISDDLNCTACPLEELKETKTLMYIIRRNTSVLRFLDRVRVQEISLQFVGLTTNDPDDYIHVSIRNAGWFEDSYLGQVYNFTSAPLQRSFIYNPQTEHIMLRGMIHPKHSYFVETTPFTTWIFDISDVHNPVMDLTNVTQIKLTIKGTAVSKFASFTQRVFYQAVDELTGMSVVVINSPI